MVITKKKINFGAGPAKIPEAVMERAHEEFLEYPGSGISILEMSHRSKDFAEVLNTTEKLLREEMSIPNEFEVLFLQGGATGQFSAIPLNLKNGKESADYAITGSWSSKSALEATKYINVNHVFPPQKPYVTIPDESNWRKDPRAAYLYYCANETIHGIEFPRAPETLEGVPLVADVSSNVLSRPFSFEKHGVVFGGTQKNLGAAGLTITVVRRDLIGNEHPLTPTVFNYAEMTKHHSVYNTPSVYSIYMTKLVVEWIRDNGGVNSLYERNQAKAKCIYEIINNSKGFYSCPVDPKYRSLMNIPFRVGGAAGDDELENKFIAGAAEMGMIGLKGHRSVGGIRASLYNAITMEETMKLGEYMKHFMEVNYSNH
uniref:phosphoserine transaminase n=1 Tax=Ascaris suum TaxID=6253 RepID=F1L3A7_ASCSU